MPQPVEQLRAELQRLGYLTRGFERWFGLDPWSSRTFWSELLLVASKAALLIAPFLSAFLSFVLAWRNHLAAAETLFAAALYFVVSFAALFLLVVAAGLLLRLQADAAVANPRLLTVLAILVTTLLSLAIGAWWYGFEAAPRSLELVVGVALIALFFVVAVSTLAAAMLSFSIYESGNIPRVQRARNGAIIGGSTALLALLFVIPTLVARGPAPTPRPQQIVVAPSHQRIALVAVDGLTSQLGATRRDLTAALPLILTPAPLPSGSPPELWTTIGSGVRPELHGVHSIEGIRLAGTAHVLQAVSRFDFVLRHLVPIARLGARQPLPPTARRREFLWEIIGSRGIPAASINWWSTAPQPSAALSSVTQEAIFQRATRLTSGGRGPLGLAVDAAAIERLDALLRETPPLVALYLPSLDIVLNRMESDSPTRVALSVQAIDRIVRTVTLLEQHGYRVLLVGTAGERQSGAPLIATDLPLTRDMQLLDLAPTLLDLFGFPASEEMPGRSRLQRSTQERIVSYGSRESVPDDATTNREYFENLKSLGYIR